MARSLYVAASGPESGKSIVALGVLEAIRRRVGRVAVYRPVVRSNGPDPLLRMLGSRIGAPEPDSPPGRRTTGRARGTGQAQDTGQVRDTGQVGRTRKAPPAPGAGAASRPGTTAGVTGATGATTCTAAWGVTYDDVHADPKAAIGTIVERFRALERDHDAVLVVGTDYTDVGAPTELAFNGQVAVNLGAPVLLVVSGTQRAPEDIQAGAEIARQDLAAKSCQILGVVANRVATKDIETVRRLLAPFGGCCVIPELPVLSAPTIGQLIEACDAELILGAGERLDVEAEKFVVAAMTLPRVLEHLTDSSVVILPGDRADLLVGVLTAHRSQTFPRLSGVLLTGGLPPEPNILLLLDGLNTELPMALTSLNTFEAATVAVTTTGALTDGSERKVQAALDLFTRCVDTAGLLDRLDLARSVAVTPLMFENDLVERARSDRRRIVLPEGTEPRVLTAASQVLARNIADITLLGNPDAVTRAAAMAGVDISDALIVDPREKELRNRLAAEYHRLRAHKGVTEDAALDVVTDVSYAGTLMVGLGLADGMVSGAVHTTAHTIRPAFETLRTSPGVCVVSSVFFMCLTDRVLVYGDCAVNPDPTAEQLADIATSSAKTAAAFGVEPRVAMLSYSTGESGRGIDVDKVRQATCLVRQREPWLQVEGPIQYDAAIDAGVANTKLPDSTVAGRATVFIFPDLNTGNNTYKAVQRSAGAVAVGPVLQGLRRPVNDLSRGATVPDIVTTIAITAVQSQQMDQHEAEANR